MSPLCLWMIASRSFNLMANFTFMRFNLVSTNLLYVEFANSLQRFFSTVVLDFARFSLNMFTYSNKNGACLNRMRWWMWWPDIPVECLIAKKSNVRDTIDEIQDRRWASVYSPLSLCSQCHSSQHTSWFHQNTYLLSVLERTVGHWTCHGVLLVLRYRIRYKARIYRLSWVTKSICLGYDWSSPSLLVVEVYPPIRKASCGTELLRTGCSHRDSRCRRNHAISLTCSFLSMSIMAYYFAIWVMSPHIFFNHRMASSISFSSINRMPLLS